MSVNSGYADTLNTTEGKSTNCSGQAKLAGTNFEVRTNLTYKILQEGELLELSSPITMDTEQVVQLKIEKAIPIANGVYIIAFASDHKVDFGSPLLFNAIQDSTGKVTIKDFKGFEADKAFGPSELQCEKY